MKDEARMPGASAQDLGMLVAAVVVEDHVDHLAGRDRVLDRIEEAQELLVPALRDCNGQGNASLCVIPDSCLVADGRQPSVSQVDPNE
jgi:hypothetical protein